VTEGTKPSRTMGTHALLRHGHCHYGYHTQQELVFMRLSLPYDSPQPVTKDELHQPIRIE
jgi:hypothetical protein